MRRSNLVAAVAFASVAVAVASFGSTANAQVIRCTDAAGKVSYTDKACPPNTRRSEQLEGMDTNGTTVGGSAPVLSVPTVRSTEPAPLQPQPNGGLTVIDPRARDLAESQRQARERNEQEAADRTGAGVYPYPNSYGGYTGGYRRPARPQDLRTTLRNCDAGGCNDTMGNHYDRAGKVDRYVRPDGRTCRPVGTTVVC